MTAEPLRILQLYPKEDYFTGAAIQLRELALGLRARGHHVVVATRPSPLWRQKTAEANVPHVALPMSHGLDMRSVFGIVRLLREHHFQVVHCHKGRARTLALLAGLFERIPVLILNRGVSFPLDRWNRLGYTTDRVTAIVAVCESIKRGLIGAGVTPEKIEVIYSGTDTDRFHPGVDGSRVRSELGLQPDHFLATQIGVRSWRGNDDVLDAMARVAGADRQPQREGPGARDRGRDAGARPPGRYSRDPGGQQRHRGRLLRRSGADGIAQGIAGAGDTGHREIGRAHV